VSGKTSLVTNLSGAIERESNKKILIIDTDGQGNASIAFGLNPHEYKDTLYDVLVGEKRLKDIIIEIEDNIHIAPSNNDMNFLEFDILPDIQQYNKPFELLRKAIEDVKDDYDYIFIDTPPSMGLVAGNVLSVADKVIIPFAPEMFAVTGLIRVVEAINEFKNKENPSLEIEGVVGMMVDGRTKLHSEMLEQAKGYCMSKDIKMYETLIPKSIRFANSFAYEQKPATMTDYRNYLVKSYFSLAEEMISNG
jgi:chromosome partitioning protein